MPSEKETEEAADLEQRAQFYLEHYAITRKALDRLGGAKRLDELDPLARSVFLNDTKRLEKKRKAAMERKRCAS